MRENRSERKRREREQTQQLAEAKELVRDAQVILKLAYFPSGTSRSAYLGSWRGGSYSVTTRRRAPINGNDIAGGSWDLSVRGCVREILAHQDQLAENLRRISARTPNSISGSRR